MDEKGLVGKKKGLRTWGVTQEKEELGGGVGWCGPKGNKWEKR